MAERQRIKLCYNCDDRYVPGHKCNKHNFFQIDVSSHTQLEDIPEEDTPAPKDAETTLPP